MSKIPHNLTYKKTRLRKFSFSSNTSSSDGKLEVEQLYNLDVEIKDTSKKYIVEKLKSIIDEIENETYKDKSIFKQTTSDGKLGKVNYTVDEYQNVVLDKDGFHGYD